MKYYTYTSGLFKSPEYQYFDSIEELNEYYDIDATESDFDRGYSFEYEGKTYFLGCEEDEEYNEDEEYDEVCDFE